ncbi:MAG: efflux RND transporter periplasmic adaptor subunit [Bdellovibrionales bacterium]|jgi:macrolide-specific efflux system membrane fusion protein|nr:efflux RND transporter periplasmic adaptor subunit [Bdellovibrionales bacterium]
MKLKLWIGLIAIAFLSGIGWHFYSQNKKTKAEAGSYVDSKIERGDILVTIRSTGTVQPANRLEIKPPIAGRVERVLITEGANVRRGQILAWMSSTERAAVLDAARAKGAEEVARWEDLYRATPVLSPINGTVILRKVEPGQTFSSTDAILVLSDRLTVKAQVDETDLAQIKVGLEADVTLDAYPNEPVPAKVMRIAYEAKTVNNVTMYEVDVTPNNTPETMRSGMTATVRFNIASKEKVLVVPNSAIRTENAETFVIMPAPGAERRRVKVELGLTDGRSSEILSGLNEGDIVSSPTLGAAAGGAARASNPFAPGPPSRARSGNRSGGSSR